MATIIEPATTRAIAVRTLQPLRLEADASTSWWARTNGGPWSLIASSATVVVWETPSSVTRRRTFDEIQIAAEADEPSAGYTGGLHLNLCEGPATVLQATAAIRNEALAEPWPNPDLAEHDDPPLGVPLLMPGANRNSFGTVLLESCAEPGGPANATSLLGAGASCDTSGKLAVRTTVFGRVSGLGPFPAITSLYNTGLYFGYDFGRARTLGLTRVLFEHASPGNVAIGRGDGRRNTYRYSGGSYTAAASLRNALTSGGGVFTETLPSGTQFKFNAAAGGVASLDRIIDRYGNTIYYSYDVNGRLQKLQGPPGASGLVPYLAYDASGQCSAVVLEDALAPANNRTTYFHYDGTSKNLVKAIGPELCITYFEYNTAPDTLAAITDPEGFRWYFAYDASTSRLQFVVDPLGKAAYFVYDPAAPLTTLKDRAAKATYFHFNAFGSPTRVFNVGTPADYYTYDGEANLTTAKNRLGNQWTYEYDSRANRIAATDPLGARWYFAYDGQDLLRFQIDPLGRFTYLDYDASRNRTAQRDPAGNTAYYHYQPTGLLHFRKDRRGAFTYLGFDAKANNTALVDALSFRTYYDYNSAGERAAMVDPLDRVWYWAYDKRGRVVETKDAYAKSQFAYDSRCNLVIQTAGGPREEGYDDVIEGTAGVAHYWPMDEASGTTLADAVGIANGTAGADVGVGEDTSPIAERPAPNFPDEAGSSVTLGSLTVPAACSVEMWVRADALGGDAQNLVALEGSGETLNVEIVDGEVLVYDQDAADYEHFSVSLDATWRHLVVTFDGTNEVSVYLDGELKETRPLTGQHSAFTATTRQVAGEWSSVRFQGSLAAIALYAGVLSAETILRHYEASQGLPAAREATYFTYDGNSNRTRVAQLLGGTSFLATYFRYDPEERLEGQKDARLNEVTWTYDALGRRQVQTDPLGGKAYWAYDAAHEVQFATDARGNPSYLEYDPVGRLQKQKDAYLNATYHVYDLKGNRTRVVDARQNPTYFTFDSRDWLTETKNAIFATNKSEYDEEQNRVKAIDPRGKTTYFTYDLRGLMTHQKDAAFNVSYMGYDGARQQVLRLDEQNAPTYLTYDEVGRQQHVRDAYQNQTYLGYDLSGNNVLSLDELGFSAQHTYDAANRRTRTRDAYGNEEVTEYDGVGNSTKSVNRRGFAWYYTFDALNRRTHEKDPVHFAQTYHGYDPVGNRVVMVDPQGFATYHTFDRLNRQESVLDPGMLQTYYAYDAVSNRVEARLEQGWGRQPWGSSPYGGERRSTYFEFDAINRTTKQIDALGGQRLSEYDDANNRTKEVDEEGRPTYFTYDNLNREDTRKNAFLDTWTAVYDERGSVTRRIDPEGRTTYFAYDLKQRQVTQSNSLGEVTYWGHDARSDQVLVTNPRSYSTYFTFDRLQRATHQKDARSGIRYFGFDAVGNQVLQLDELQNPSYFRFDGLDRLNFAIDAFFAQTYLGYDGRSSLTRRRDADGRETYYTYDGAKRMSAPKPTADPWIYYAYDAVGNLTVCRDETGVTLNPYDKLNRTSSKTTVAGTVYYEYDRTGLKTRLKDPSFEQNYYVYDAAGRLARVEISNARAAYYLYDASGLLLRRALPGNNVIAYHKYDNASRVARIENRGPTYDTLISYYSYVRNPNGLEEVTTHEDGENTYYAYDELDRLTSEVRKSGATSLYGFTYSYDAASNRLSKTDIVNSQVTYYSYNTLNLLTREYLLPTNATTYYSYDLSQRRTQEHSPSLATYFGYNSRHMIAQIDQSGAMPDAQRTFKYTGTGEPVLVRDNSSSTLAYWAHDAHRPVYEKDTSGSITRYRRNQLGPGALSALLEVQVADVMLYPATAGSGSVERWVDPEAADRYTFDTFGVRLTMIDAMKMRPQFRSVELIKLKTSDDRYVTSRGELYNPKSASMLLGGLPRLLLLAGVGEGPGPSSFRLHASAFRLSGYQFSPVFRFMPYKPRRKLKDVERDGGSAEDVNNACPNVATLQSEALNAASAGRPADRWTYALGCIAKDASEGTGTELWFVAARNSDRALGFPREIEDAGKKHLISYVKKMGGRLFFARGYCHAEVNVAWGHLDAKPGFGDLYIGIARGVKGIGACGVCELFLGDFGNRFGVKIKDWTHHNDPTDPKPATYDQNETCYNQTKWKNTDAAGASGTVDAKDAAG